MRWLPALAPSMTRKTTEKPTVKTAPTRLTQNPICSYLTWWATRRRSRRQAGRDAASVGRAHGASSGATRRRAG